MRFHICVDVAREYGYKELHDMDMDELGAILMDSLEVGFDKNKIVILDITKIHKEIEE